MAPDDALDGVLKSLRQRREAPWREASFDARAMTGQAFEDHVAALCANAQAAQTGVDGDPQAGGQRNGQRTAEHIRRRVIARETASARRTALDLQRLADLDERMRVRQAEAVRKRWFVLGRLLTRAAAADPRWADFVQLLITSVKLTAHEERALGLAPRKP